MKDAGAGSHPLHIARVDHAAITGAVMMRYAAFIRNGNGFKTLVRVNTHAAQGFGRAEIELGVKIQHQERAHALLQLQGAGDIIKHPEAVAYHAGPGRLWNDCFYGSFHILIFLPQKYNGSTAGNNKLIKIMCQALLLGINYLHFHQQQASMKTIFILLLTFSCIQNVYSRQVAPSFPDNMETQLPVDSMPYALIAGGSKGIGYAIAEALARRGYNLVLVARHADSLQSAKRKLESAYGIHVDLLMYDLSREESARDIAQWCMDRDIRLKMLCNVAGYGGSRDYLSLPIDTLYYMVRLNIESVMGLTLRLLPLLEKNAPSYILNVASMAAFAPIPQKNLYSATKSAVLYFSYSLRYQLKNKRISVSCLNPGPVFTKPSIVKDTKKSLGWIGMQMAVPPEKVGEIAVRKTLKRKLVIVPGTLASIASGIIRVLPRRLVVAVYHKLNK
jgi:short-subunit dehydrogenase